MTKHKILIVLTPPFAPYSGGVQMSTYKMATYFSAKGHVLSIFSFAHQGHIEPEFASLYHAKEENQHDNNANLRELQSVVEDISPDVVINQMPYEHQIGAVLISCQQQNSFLLLGCLRNTLFSVVKNIEAYRKNVLPNALQPFFANPLGRKLLLHKHKRNHSGALKSILDQYDYFVVFGSPNKKELEYFIGDYKSDKVAYIPNSIPTVLDEVPKKEKVILYLSRLDYAQKRADLILPLWKKLMDELPEWRMEIVGGGVALEDLKVQINKEKIPRVEVLGKQKPDEYYRKSPIYIMTSAFEGFPNTLIEAQSFGAVPVIYDNYPMAGWVVNEAEDAFLIPPFKIDKMAQQILLLARDERKTQLMAKAALENARRFTIDRVGQKWLEFFEKKLGV